MGLPPPLIIVLGCGYALSAEWRGDDVSDNEGIEGRFELHYDPATYRRMIAGKDAIIHCHHYNSHDQPVCTFTGGYIQGALFAVSGQLVRAREVECMARGDQQCVFKIDSGHAGRTAPAPAPAPNTRQPFDFQPKTTGQHLHSPNVDEQKIIDALVGMPFHGNAQGLIPAFSVYLANTPADYSSPQ